MATSNDCPAAAAAVAGTAEAEQQQQRWHKIVERLAQPDALDGESVKTLLQQAVLSAQADGQWANSGIQELLCRARDSAANGFHDNARKAAVGLLGFHMVVERYRMAHPVGSSSGEGKNSPTMELDENEVASAQPGPGQGHRSPCINNNNSSHDNSSGTNTARGDGERKRRRSIAEQIPLQEDSSPAAAAGQDSPPLHGEQRMAIWHGPIHLQFGDCSEEFCSVALQVPAPVLEELPTVLRACSIQQRRGLRTQGQIACRTSITHASPRQLAELHQMAQHELVAIAPLEDCVVILAPYLTEAVDPRSNLNFKVATFIAALCA